MRSYEVIASRKLSGAPGQQSWHRSMSERGLANLLSAIRLPSWHFYQILLSHGMAARNASQEEIALCRANSA